jgi:hypothetical protein
LIVELKKTKITKSIVDQSLRGNYSIYLDNKSYDILGWCLMTGKSKLRYTLLYERASNQVIKLPHIVSEKDVELTHEGVQRGSNKGGWVFPVVYRIKVRWRDFNNTQYVYEQFEDSDEIALEKFQKVKDFVHIVNQKSQIYL